MFCQNHDIWSLMIFSTPDFFHEIQIDFFVVPVQAINKTRLCYKAGTVFLPHWRFWFPLWELLPMQPQHIAVVTGMGTEGIVEKVDMISKVVLMAHLYSQSLKKGGDLQERLKEKEEIHYLQKQLAALKDITVGGAVIRLQLHHLPNLWLYTGLMTLFIMMSGTRLQFSHMEMSTCLCL